VVIAIFGPTGVGKTEVAIATGERLRLRGESPVAISCDAFQVYRGLEGLTGAPSRKQREALEHRLVGFLDISESFSAGRFARLAHQQIDDCLNRGCSPIVVGGAGLYLRAALSDLNLKPPAPQPLRRALQDQMERLGPRHMHGLLCERDADAGGAIEPTDRSRIVRALELLEMGYAPPSRGNSQLWTQEMRHPTLLVGLVMRRENLYARIDQRVDAMVEQGVYEEVFAADRNGASTTARKALGFSDLLAGDVEAMKRRTRRYAKRQLTWMRKLEGVRLLDTDNLTASACAQRIVSLYQAGTSL
jgi:tRNA dimethylallyltransferase